MPKFSIIMPTYNRKFCIETAIHSVLNQNFSDYELIIVDDGSADGTMQLINKVYQQEINDTKIKFFRIQNNAGQSAARNIGLKNSSATWICYLDTDNSLTENALSTICKYIEDNPEAQCFYGKRVNEERQEFNYKKLKKNSYIDLNIFVHNKILYDKYGGFDEKLEFMEDWELIVRYTKRYKPVFIDKFLVNYNNGNNFERISTQKGKRIKTRLRVQYLILRDDFSIFQLIYFLGKSAELCIKGCREMIKKAYGTLINKN